MEKTIDEKTKYWYTQENANELICDLSKKKKWKKKCFIKEVSRHTNSDINQTNSYFKLNFKEKTCLHIFHIILTYI